MPLLHKSFREAFGEADFAFALRALLERTERMYADAGAKLKGLLLCRKCGHSAACSAQDAAAYVRAGWPRHCHQTMDLISRGAP
jgi:hypothetical protein